MPFLRLPKLQIAYQQCCVYLDAEGDSQNVGKPSDSGHTDGHDNSHWSRLVSADCFLTHVGARIKACDRELGHQHANQKDVPTEMHPSIKDRIARTDSQTDRETDRPTDTRACSDVQRISAYQTCRHTHTDRQTDRQATSARLFPHAHSF